MLNNRKLEVSVVKKKKTDGTEEADFDKELDVFGHKAGIVAAVAENAVIKIGLVVGAYIVLDTARQVVVNATRK